MTDHRHEIRRALGEIEEVAELLTSASERLWGVLDSAARDVQLFNAEEVSVVAQALAGYRDQHRSAAHLSGGGSETARAHTRTADLADALRCRVLGRKTVMMDPVEAPLTADVAPR